MRTLVSFTKLHTNTTECWSEDKERDKLKITDLKKVGAPTWMRIMLSVTTKKIMLE